MKKFQFAAGLLAVGLLASCSSDAPEMPNNTPVDNGTKGEKCIAIRLSSNDTRAVADDENAIEGESDIKDVRLYICDNSGKVFFNEVTELIDNEMVATYKVSSVTYNSLAAIANKGDNVKVYVVCNAKNNNSAVPAGFDKSEVSDDTWNKGMFLFSNNVAVEGKLVKPVDGQGTDTNPWKINNGGDGELMTVEVERLAVRFDLVDPEVKKAATDQSLNLTVAGMSVIDEANSTYWFKQTTTPAFTATELKIMKSYDWNLAPSMKEGKVDAHIYGRPLIKNGTNLNDGAFAIVKVQIDSDNEAIKNVITAGEKTLYAYNGYLLGTIDMINAEDFEFTAKAEEGKDNSAEVAAINETIKNMKAAGFGTIVESNLTPANGFFAYTPDTDKKYYTYYYNTINTGSKLGTVERNNIYKLNAKSFTKLGSNGNYIPGGDPQPEQVDMYFELEIVLKAWVLQPNDWVF